MEIILYLFVRILEHVDNRLHKGCPDFPLNRQREWAVCTAHSVDHHTLRAMRACKKLHNIFFWTDQEHAYVFI